MQLSDHSIKTINVMDLMDTMGTKVKMTELSWIMTLSAH